MVEPVFGILAIAACAALVALAVFIVREKTRKAEEEVRRKASEIIKLYNEMAGLADFDSGYLMKRDWDEVLKSAATILKALAGIPDDVIETSEVASQISFIREHSQNPTFREERNSSYKDHELRLCNTLLSNVDGGRSLDPQQRDAIVTDEYSNLVIAGAGSGKTSVVVGKVKYLVERWHVDPSEILVTSFTRASVDDLKSRIEASGVKVFRPEPSTRWVCAS